MMNTEHLNNFGNRFDPRSIRQLEQHASLNDRLAQPSVLISIAALIVTSILYTSSGRDGTLWNLTVYLIPYRVLYFLETWLYPPIAPRPMLAAPARVHAAKSELLGKILGLDRPGGGGLLSVFSQAGHRGLSSVSGAMSSLKEPSNNPPGLGNLNNSCYQNSILQGLASLKPLPTYLFEQLRNVDADDPRHEATVNLRTLIADLNDASNNGRTFWTPPSLKNMSTIQQQDAQEYFAKLLDEVDKEISKTAPKTSHTLPTLDREGSVTSEDTNGSLRSGDSGYQSVASSSRSATEVKPPRNPLEGLVAQRVACVQCGHSDGLSLINFNCLTLNLGTNPNETDLYQLLDEFTNIESIEGVQCGKCTLLKVRKLLEMVIERSRSAGAADDKLSEPLSRLEAVEESFEIDDYEDKTLTEKCKITSAHKVNSTKTKQVVVARPPQSLALHMNRSAFDEETFSSMKNHAPVKFPVTLDLGPWCLGSAGAYKRTAESSQNGGAFAVEPAHPDEEEWLFNPRSSMVAGDKGQSKVTGPLYELRAVVTHYGRHNNGHYVCYRQFPRHSPPSGSAVKTQDVGAEAESGEGEADSGSVLAETKESAEEEPTRESSAVPESEAETEMEWWRLSDETVYKVDEETVLDQGGVFMLFYDCVDPNGVFVNNGQSRGVEATDDANPALFAGEPVTTDGINGQLPTAQPPAEVDGQVDDQGAFERPAIQAAVPDRTEVWNNDEKLHEALVA